MHADGIAIPSERVGQCRATKYNSDDKLERVYHRFFLCLYFFTFTLSLSSLSFFILHCLLLRGSACCLLLRGSACCFGGSNMLNIALGSVLLCVLCVLCSGEEFTLGRKLIYSGDLLLRIWLWGEEENGKKGENLAYFALRKNLKCVNACGYFMITLLWGRI